MRIRIEDKPGEKKLVTEIPPKTLTPVLADENQTSDETVDLTQTTSGVSGAIQSHEQNGEGITKSLHRPLPVTN